MKPRIHVYTGLLRGARYCRQRLTAGTRRNFTNKE